MDEEKEYKCEKCKWFNPNATEIWDECTNGADYYCVVNGYILFEGLA